MNLFLIKFNLYYYSKMKHYLRILTINLCYECGKNKSLLINKWIEILSKLKGDILFIQEITSFNLEKLASNLQLKILNINHFEGICVLINPNKLIIVDNNIIKLKSNIEPIYISGIHLDDIPSLPHHINGIIYKSSEIIPLTKSLNEILKLCAKRRLPKVKEELKKAKKYNIAIIGGDFNEPSHLDLDNINTPVSKEFEKNGFIDTFWYANKKIKNLGYTWPAGNFYKKDPKQRIDMIYTKNLKILNSSIYDGEKEDRSKWISDHKLVITDLEI